MRAIESHITGLWKTAYPREERMSSQYCEYFDQIAMAVPAVSFAYASTGCARILHEINWKELLYLFTHRERADQARAFKAKRRPPVMLRNGKKA